MTGNWFKLKFLVSILLFFIHLIKKLETSFVLRRSSTHIPKIHSTYILYFNFVHIKYKVTEEHVNTILLFFAWKLTINKQQVSSNRKRMFTSVQIKSTEVVNIVSWDTSDRILRCLYDKISCTTFIFTSLTH